ncbi:UDP-N-acetylmuramoyl-tripeptide--D-alanyl-D-alanine ligase [Legionella yabuuchiae]|uniref:UDP-N-acetylmuramoyl-tripeptide--D-alanyl-D- alanine ligase n=1 Tax=Legionella yabuuchiae TaxID=376727 RepID=UPI00105540D6|nr:UDP-N-acetylmuramoyl-tripeptide--D-alanyl-D-alanine ligase [Legionella yabuuchiae]
MMLAEVASVLNAVCTENFELQDICIDSRRVNSGSLFVAIKGERFDGHDFIKEAISMGASAVVCQRKIDHVNVPQFIVQDTIAALADIACYHRSKFTCGVIALTGSNGKTTVKEMIAAILPQPAFATKGNLNNHIGVPLSALQLNSNHRYAVFELGANHPNEIAHTVSIVKPKVTLINNIAPAHIEGFGSIDGVALAKGEIHQGLAAGGTAIINDDDEYAHFWDSSLIDKNIVRFSLNKPVDVYAHKITLQTNKCAQFMLMTPKGEAAIQLQVPGLHNVNNALAAAACTYALGIGLSDIKAGLNQFCGVSGRMTHRIGKQGALIIDDTYNANLQSALKALDVLSQYEGKRIFVLGDMGELGDWSKKHHQLVGQAAKELDIDELYTYGQHSQHTTKTFGEHAYHFTSHQELAECLLKKLDKTTVVLVKGSRSSAMENVVNPLIDFG